MGLTNFMASANGSSARWADASILYAASACGKLQKTTKLIIYSMITNILKHVRDVPASTMPAQAQTAADSSPENETPQADSLFSWGFQNASTQTMLLDDGSQVGLHVSVASCLASTHVWLSHSRCPLGSSPLTENSCTSANFTAFCKHCDSLTSA